MLGGTAIQWYQSPGYWRVIVYVYKALMQQANFSYSAAASFLQNIVGCPLLC